MPRKHILAKLFIAGLMSAVSPAGAGGLFLEVPMTRIFACKGQDAAVEVYVPQLVIQKRDIAKIGLGRTVNGLYALDLSGSHKGKTIEAVRLRSTKDNKAIVLDQFTRKGLKPAVIPMAGGTLDLDQRFGTKVTCEPFRTS
jgi:hypothetical protein